MRAAREEGKGQGRRKRRGRGGGRATQRGVLPCLPRAVRQGAARHREKAADAIPPGRAPAVPPFARIMRPACPSERMLTCLAAYMGQQQPSRERQRAGREGRLSLDRLPCTGAQFLLPLLLVACSFSSKPATIPRCSPPLSLYSLVWDPTTHLVAQHLSSTHQNTPTHAPHFSPQAQQRSVQQSSSLSPFRRASPCLPRHFIRTITITTTTAIMPSEVRGARGEERAAKRTQRLTSRERAH